MQRYFEIYEVMIKYDGVEVLFREFDQDGRVAFTGTIPYITGDAITAIKTVTQSLKRTYCDCVVALTPDLKRVVFRDPWEMRSYVGEM